MRFVYGKISQLELFQKLHWSAVIFYLRDGHQSMDEMTKLEEYPPKDSHEMDEMGDDLKMTMVTMVTMVTMLVTV